MTELHQAGDGALFVGPPGAAWPDGFVEIGRTLGDGMTYTLAPQSSFGTYRPCSGCKAPIVVPFPNDWSLDLIKVGPPHGPVESSATPHRPHCRFSVDAGGVVRDPAVPTRPGKAINVSGRYVRDLNVNLAG